MSHLRSKSKAMEDQRSEGIANRGEPLPVIDLHHGDDRSVTGEGRDVPEPPKRRSSGLRDHLSWSPSKERGKSMQDRLLEKLLQQMIPAEDQAPKNYDPSTPLYPDVFPERPPFNLSTMSTNFRRFNTRIGVVFIFQARLLRLLAWKKYSHTLSFLAVYTFICLDPYLLTALPFALLVLAVLIPSFMARHPAPPTTLTSGDMTYSTRGPPIAPAPTVKPVKELSKDFFRNMRDLQNVMEDFSRAHDQILEIATPNTNFSNEPLSSALFIFSFITCIVMFIAAHLLPWRFICLGAGWAGVLACHPVINHLMSSTKEQHFSAREASAKSWVDDWISKDIILDSVPETREVEIFELQRLSPAGDEWEPWLFSTSPYDPKEPGRVIGDRPRGTRFFEDVQPPAGWEWSEKKWVLDLWSREWVEERIITGVEVETEGERWVYDIHYGDEGRFQSGLDIDAEDPHKTPAKTEADGKAKLLPSWEEGADASAGRRGTWRRRRWVRTVKRRYISATPDNTST